jgi:hypothetical protein
MASHEDGVAKGPLKIKNKKTYREIEYEILYARIEGIGKLYPSEKYNVHCSESMLRTHPRRYA